MSTLAGRFVQPHRQVYLDSLQRDKEMRAAVVNVVVVVEAITSATALENEAEREGLPSTKEGIEATTEKTCSQEHRRPCRDTAEINSFVQLLSDELIAYQPLLEAGLYSTIAAFAAKASRGC